MTISSLYKKLGMACQQNGKADVDYLRINKDQEGEEGLEAPRCFRAFACFSLTAGGVSYERLYDNPRPDAPSSIPIATNSSGNPD